MIKIPLICFWIRNDGLCLPLLALGGGAVLTQVLNRSSAQKPAFTGTGTFLLGVTEFFVCLWKVRGQRTFQLKLEKKQTVATVTLGSLVSELGVFTQNKNSCLISLFYNIKDIKACDSWGGQRGGPGGPLPPGTVGPDWDRPLWLRTPAPRSTHT